LPHHSWLCAARQSAGDRGGGDASQSDGKTCFVKGFDTSLDEDAVRGGLQEAFGEYGDVAEVRLPFDRDNGCLKGFGYVVFAEASGGPVRRSLLLYMFVLCQWQHFAVMQMPVAPLMNWSL
jgi:RNA recognition motif. (a.k.a. RRM, RBD, or RNP domain)